MNSSYSHVVVTSLIVSVFCGCATIKPELCPETERDLQVWEGLKGPNEKVEEDKFSVAVVASSDGSTTGPTGFLESSLTEELSRFDFFEIAERSENLGALRSEDIANGDLENTDQIPGAEYLIAAKVLGTSSKEDKVERDLTGAGAGGAVGAGLGGALGAASTHSMSGGGAGLVTGGLLGAAVGGSVAASQNLSLDFRFYEVATKKLLLSRKIDLTCSGDNANVNTAISKAARQFALELCMKYAPPAVVMESRGSGKVVRISMGKNYGLQKGSYIGFYCFRDNSKFKAGFEKVRSDIGQGKVVVLNTKDAWVQVDNYKNSQIKLGHFAALKEDQEAAKTWKDKIKVWE